MVRANLLLLLIACSCVQVLDDPLARIIVRDAHLERVSLANFGAVYGGGYGEADLVVNDIDDEQHVFPGKLETTDVGLVLDASAVITFDADFPFVFPPEQINARQLVGLYEGPHVGGDLIAGAHWRELTNTLAPVKINVTAFSLGLGFVPVTWEQLKLSLVDDPIVLGEGVGGAAICIDDVDCDGTVNATGEPTTVCDLEVGVCVPGCSSDGDCQGDQQCGARGLCEPLPHPPPRLERAPHGPPELPAP